MAPSPLCATMCDAAGTPARVLPSLFRSGARKHRGRLQPDPPRCFRVRTHGVPRELFPLSPVALPSLLRRHLPRPHQMPPLGGHRSHPPRGGTRVSWLI